LRADVAELRTDVDKLRTDVAVLQSGQEELRRVTSSNHFRVMGRIEQLSDQIIRHVAAPDHGPADDGRQRA
jgi:hypothetical protein